MRFFRLHPAKNIRGNSPGRHGVNSAWLGVAIVALSQTQGRGTAAPQPKWIEDGNVTRVSTQSRKAAKRRKQNSALRVRNEVSVRVFRVFRIAQFQMFPPFCSVLSC